MVVAIKQLLKDQKIVFLDGSMGAFLEDQNSLQSSILPWGVGQLLINPSEILDLHEKYLDIGCNVITTHGFRSQKRSLVSEIKETLLKLSDKNYEDEITEISDGWGESYKGLTTLATLLANEAIGLKDWPQPVAVAGNLTTIEDCYQPADIDASFEVEHKEKLSHLLDSKLSKHIDIVLLETMSSAREAELAASNALKLSQDRLVWVSFGLDRKLEGDPVPANNDAPRLYRRDKSDPNSGDLLLEAIQVISSIEVSGKSVDAILFNCTSVSAISSAFGKLSESGIIDRLKKQNIFFGAYANAQHYKNNKWIDDPEMKDGRYLLHVNKWVEHGAQIIGGCCGVGPDDIKFLIDGIDIRSHE